MYEQPGQMTLEKLSLPRSIIAPDAEMSTKCASVLAMLKRNTRRRKARDAWPGAVDNAKKKFRPNITVATDIVDNSGKYARESFEHLFCDQNRRAGYWSDESDIRIQQNGRVITPPPEFSNLTTTPPEFSPASPCSSTDPPMSPAKRRFADSPPPSPRSPPLMPSSPAFVPSSPPARTKSDTTLGELLCKSCNRVLDRPSSCCGTYSVALCIRVENIPKKYRPSVTRSGVIRAHFPSFAKAKRYRNFLSNQMSKKRNLRFLVNLDLARVAGMAGIPPRYNPSSKPENKSMNDEPTGYVPPMLMAARTQSQYQHPAAAVGMTQSMQDIRSQAGMQDIRSHAGMQDIRSHAGMQDIRSHPGMQDIRSHTGMQDIRSHTGMQDIRSHTDMQDILSHTSMQDILSQAGMQDIRSHTGMQGIRSHTGSHTGMQDFNVYRQRF